MPSAFFSRTIAIVARANYGSLSLNARPIAGGDDNRNRAQHLRPLRHLPLRALGAAARSNRRVLASLRLSHIQQIASLSLPCLGIYHWLRTQISLTPATFRLPHPRPSARLGDSLAAENKRMPPKHPLRVRAMALEQTKPTTPATDKDPKPTP